jgi:hypothetical protein
MLSVKNNQTPAFFSHEVINTYHFRRKVEIKGFVTRPETSCQNSDCQVYTWVCLWVRVEILLKLCLVLPCKSEISDLGLTKSEYRLNITMQIANSLCLKSSLIQMSTGSIFPNIQIRTQGYQSKLYG